jgi:hypothetical protein
MVVALSILGLVLCWSFVFWALHVSTKLMKIEIQLRHMRDTLEEMERNHNKERMDLQVEIERLRRIGVEIIPPENPGASDFDVFAPH